MLVKIFKSDLLKFIYLGFKAGSQLSYESEMTSSGRCD